MNNMKKAFNRIALITIVIAIVNLIATIIFITRLPDTVPVHFNVNFECDRLGSRWNGVVPTIILLLTVPIMILTERNGKNFEVNKKPMSIMLIIIEFVIVTINWLLLALMGSGVGIGEKMSFSFEFLIMLILGFMMIMIGNYIPTVRQNKTLGIKLPWTLKNEKCWNLTHRFSGKLYVIAGIITLAMAMAMKIWSINPVAVFVAYIIVGIPLMIVIPTFYAYQHRND